jgi:enoyl-CoA hydratase/carnithine racemase
MTEPVLLVEKQDHVLVLKLNRPKKKNALSSDLTKAIVDAIEHAASDDAVWVVGITGMGGTFCAGADLSRDEGGRGSDNVERVIKLVTGIRVRCKTNKNTDNPQRAAR